MIGNNRLANLFKSRMFIIPSVVGLVVTCLASASSYSIVDEYANDHASIPISDDSLKSVAAFEKVYSVLMSPRCLNCHPAGDIPLQGDDSHVHTMQPKRGKDGDGILAMKCGNCHQDENTVGLKMPPGNVAWHLPPENMKMVFEGKTPGQLARQLIDPEQNGHKDMEALIAHADDGLVLWGWDPGEGRTLPPLSHSEFKEAWVTWLTTGAYAPVD